jgi:hypothetical protein
MNGLATKNQQDFGLYLFRPHRGEPGTAYALQYSKKRELGSPLTPEKKEYSVFISDEGTLYPPALQKWHICLEQFLIIQTDSAYQSWKTALEAIHTGLFRWVFLRPSKPCDTHHLRKLQIESEKKHSSVFLFSKAKLPHWFFKKQLPSLPYLEVSHDNKFITENLILSKPKSFDSFSGKLDQHHS